MRLIDADALRDRLQSLADDGWNKSTTTSWAEAFSECADMVDEAPTIEPERKKGMWIDCDGSDHWKCDKCGCRAGYWFNEENSSSWELDMSEWLSNFCPNCGADMTEDKE